ncbi:MAG TPA: hypothetical protein VKZ44_07345 [Taishania sp.]|nr:hypothetical protein [Taishania sp.]
MVKKILLITFYWPPAGGPGVHRWLRFSKYFKENNCELTVYCPENAAWPVIDESLNSEVSEDLTVIRRKVFEPHKYLQKKAGFEGGAGIGTKTNKLGFIKKMMIWTRGNLFIPDARRFWINPSYRFLKNYLKENPDITHIISTGPPHSMHVIALKLKKQFPKLHWTADFRDPWTEIDYYQELLPGKFADKMQKKLELSVLQNADLVLSIGEDCAKGLQRIGGRKVEIITNGFIFPEFDPKQIVLDSKFSIAHFGSMAASRNPVSLWKALRLALQENSKLKEYLNINLYGSVDFSITEDIAKYELTDFYTGPKQVSHKESITLQQRTQLLLLVANKAINSKGILTGKFFEYLGAKRPMLVIGESDSDLEKIVLETNSGKFFEYEEVESLKHYILTSFEQFLNQNLYSNPINIEQFHSKTLTRKIIELIK